MMVITSKLVHNGVMLYVHVALLPVYIIMRLGPTRLDESASLLNQNIFTICQKYLSKQVRTQVARALVISEILKHRSINFSCESSHCLHFGRKVYKLE